jgi:hypothetical protein
MFLATQHLLGMNGTRRTPRQHHNLRSHGATPIEPPGKPIVERIHGGRVLGGVPFAAQEQNCLTS